jgi:hypothetical protein
MHKFKNPFFLVQFELYLFSFKNHEIIHGNENFRDWSGVFEGIGSCLINKY